MKHAVEVIIGKKSHDVTLNGHQKLDVFGKGKDRDDIYWKSVLRVLLLNGYITKNIENYGLLNLSEKGEAFLKKPTKFEIAVDQKFDVILMMMMQE